MDEQHYAPPQQDSTESWSRAYMDQAQPDLIRWQLDPAEIIEEMEHKLKGEVWDAKTQKFVRRAGRDPLMNEDGINVILSLISPVISKVVILSNLKEEDIDAMMLDFSKNLICLFASEYHKFGIKKQYIPSIKTFICMIVQATLNRALNEGERKFLGRTERVSQVFTDRERSNKPAGFMSIFR